MRGKLLLGAALLLIFCLPLIGAETSGRFFAYVGTYTGGASKGIYVAKFDAATGKLSAPELAAETPNPTFLAIHPSGKFLYADSEVVADGKKSSALAAFAIDRTTGRLTALNSEPCGGRGVCHVAVDATGKCALAANYGSGSIAALPIGEDGRLGELSASAQHIGQSVNTNRQAGPHAHQVVVDAANRFLFVCDLGLDKVMSYRLNAAKAEFLPNKPQATALAAGSGPRHLAFHPNGKFAYVVSELASTVTTFAYDAEHGALKELQTSPTLPAGFTNVNTAAEVVVHPSGKFLYASNRGHDSVAVFTIDEATGQLTPAGHQPTQGRKPRFITLDPTGGFLFAANQDGGNVVVFRVDGATGKLTPTGESLQLASPVCVQFVAAE